MPRVCIVEPAAHPAPGTLAGRLSEFDGFTVRTVDSVPDNLDVGEALVLNSIPPAPGSIPEDRVLRFVEEGGGLFATLAEREILCRRQNGDEVPRGGSGRLRDQGS
jgi:hypothetical protein